MGTTIAATPPVQRTRTSTRRLRRALVWATAVIVLGLVVGYVGISAYVADQLSRPERHALENVPSKFGMTYEDVTFNSTVDNIPLSGWYIDSPGNNVIIIMHGRNGVRLGGDAVEIAQTLVKHNYDVFTFDFRAHGTSGGERYGMGQWETRDVEGAINYLKARGAGVIGAHATSMGASTMLLAAVDHPEIAAMIADSPFADLPKLLETKLPEASGLPSLFNPGILFMGKLLHGVDFSGVKPVEIMPKLKGRPILHIQNQVDEVIPVEHGRMIAAAAAGYPNFESWITPGEGHCESYKDFKGEYTEKMLAFYDKYMK